MVGRILASFLMLIGLQSQTALGVFGAGLKDVATPRAVGTAASVDSKIYFIGGIDATGKETAINEEYATKTNTWIARTAMPTARAGATAETLSGIVYVIGGRRGGEVFAACERYDPVTDAWTTCAPMPTARWNLMSAAVDGKIFVFGGITGTGQARKVVSTVECYDPKTNSWKSLRSMPVARSNAATVVLGNQVLIISGRLSSGAAPSTSPRVDVFEPINARFNVAASIAFPRTGSMAAVVDGRIYLMGGASSGEVIQKIEVYDPANQKWGIAQALLSQPRTDGCCVVIDNRIFVFGGWTKPSLSALVKTVEELRLPSAK